MKQTILMLAALLGLSISMLHSQEAALQPFIEKYRNQPGFSYSFLSKDMFEIATNSDIKEKDWQKVRQVVNNIGALTILAADSIDEGLKLYKEAKNLIPSGSFDELISVQDAKDRVKVLVRDEGNAVTDLVLLVGTEDAFVLVAFSGNLELNHIEQLTQLLRPENARQLAESSESFTAQFAIQPNPAKDDVQIQYSEPGDSPLEAAILDQSGKRLKTVQLANSAEQKLPLSNIPPGVYWLQLKTKSGKVGVKQLQIIR